MPDAYIIAGPNGAGKTTLAREFLPDDAGCTAFITADLIAGVNLEGKDRYVKMTLADLSLTAQINEAQFKRFFAKASKDKGQTGAALLRFLAAELQTRFVSAEKLSKARIPPEVLDKVPVRMAAVDPGSTNLGSPGEDGLPEGGVYANSYADIREAVGAMRDGAVNYLAKPIDLDELLGTVRHALGLERGGPLRLAANQLLEEEDA